MTPRSGRRRAGRFLWLLRAIDKARATAAGLQGEYIYPCPIDRGMMERWGIDPDEFDRAIASHGDDAAIVAWLETRTTKSSVERANAWLVATKTENLDRQDREERGVVCTNCGVAYPPSDTVAESCLICDDERVTCPPARAWISPDELAATHRCELRSCEPGKLASVTITPAFAIGQHAVLIEQSDGCILWDCLPMVDANAVEYVNARGGLKAIAVSHPHFYGAMKAWSDAFGGVPVYVHEADRQWVVDAPDTIVFWNSDVREIAPGVTLVRCGGHFDGSAVLHVAEAAGGRGALLCGDTIMVTQYGSGVSFMRSYPTYIPLTAPQVRHLRTVLEPFSFEALYGAWPDRTIESGGDDIVARTAATYLEVLAGEATAVRA